MSLIKNNNKIIHKKNNTDNTGVIIGLAISKERGTKKYPVDRIKINEKGIVGDGHSGENKKQISILTYNSMSKVIKENINFTPGDFAENVFVKINNELHKLPIGTKLKIGTAKVEITYIGKNIKNECINPQMQKYCIMTREGIFTKVISPGEAKIGDIIEII